MYKYREYTIERALDDQWKVFGPNGTYHGTWTSEATARARVDVCINNEMLQDKSELERNPFNDIFGDNSQEEPRTASGPMPYGSDFIYNNGFWLHMTTITPEGLVT